MASNLNYKQVANVERRTWDTAKYEARARARLAAAEDDDNKARSGKKTRPDGGSSADVQKTTTDSISESALALKQLQDGEEEAEEFLPAEEGRAGPELSQRAFLKARSKRITLEAKVGLTEFVQPPGVSGKKADGDSAVSITDGVVKAAVGVGWHCKVCDCVLKDSLTYLDHINGRKHQRNLGYTMRAEKSDISDVKSKLQQLAKEKEQRQRKNRKSEEVSFGEEDDGTQAAVDRHISRHERLKAKEKEISSRRQEIFKSETKQNKESVQEKKADNNEDEDEDNEEEDEEPEIDPAMAAMMGFTSFGGSK